MANIIINPAEDRLQGWDTSGNVPAEGTIFEITKSVIAPGASMSFNYNAECGNWAYGIKYPDCLWGRTPALLTRLF